MIDDLNIYAASALATNRFCVAIYELSNDDVYSIIIQYDGRNAQNPWSKVVLNRNIESITNTLSQSKGNGFAALSSEGDIYTIHGQNIENDKIPGAGLNNEDSTGLGALNETKFIDDCLYAVGLGGQVYKRNDTGIWEHFAQNIQPGNGYDTITFESVGGMKDDIYISGVADPKSVASSKELEKAIDDADARGDDDEYFRLQKLARKQRHETRKDPQGRLYHWNGAEWDDLDVDEHYPQGIFIEAPDKVWIGGGNEFILYGNAEDGFDAIEIAEKESITSITKFKGRIICAGENGLYAYTHNEDRFQGKVNRIKPKVLKEHFELAPLKVQMVDDVMFYFDYNLGIYIWDGDKTWTNITIPQDLLERDKEG